MPLSIGGMPCRALGVKSTECGAPIVEFVRCDETATLFGAPGRSFRRRVEKRIPDTRIRASRKLSCRIFAVFRVTFFVRMALRARGKKSVNRILSTQRSGCCKPDAGRGIVLPRSSDPGFCGKRARRKCGPRLPTITISAENNNV